jgi:hypothetical protein
MGFSRLMESKEASEFGLKPSVSISTLEPGTTMRPLPMEVNLTLLSNC